MSAIDLKKQLKHLYQASANEIVEVEVPSMNYLMMDGAGDPNASTYTDTVAKLFAVSYALKFMLKKRDVALDYSVMPREGLWWTKEGTPWYSIDALTGTGQSSSCSRKPSPGRCLSRLEARLRKRNSSTWPGCALRCLQKAELPRFCIPALIARKGQPSTACTLLWSSRDGT